MAKNKSVIVLDKSRKPVEEISILDDSIRGEMITSKSIERETICNLPGPSEDYDKKYGVIRIQILSCQQAEEWAGEENNRKRIKIPGRFEIRFKFYFGQ